MAENKRSFEEDLKRLEEIVKLLESSDAELDKSLALFEEGTELVRNCTKALDEAENKITILTKENQND
ncbi:MAG: exodeoxyribonuclease VII small subunit [Clostridia bacterium]|nr:exodeoxyribonuclease VII small subunit [Clostridia bacterium]